jgi:hypothetical protein
MSNFVIWKARFSEKTGIRSYSKGTSLIPYPFRYKRNKN